MVNIVEEACQQRVCGGRRHEVCGCADTVEAVNYQYCTLRLEGATGRKNLGGEALAALVHSCYLKAANDSCGESCTIAVLVYQYTVVEIAVADAGVDDVFLGIGCRLQRVGYGLPGELDFVLAYVADGKVVDR